MKTRALALILATLAAGCGGSSGSRSSSTAVAPAASGATTTTSSGSTTATTTSSTTPPPPPPPANFVRVGFETIDQGGNSPRGFAQGAHETHVATDADWASFWPTHSQAALPTVDFATETVAGTFMGQKPSGGFATQIVNVFRDTNSSDLRLLVREAPPGDWRAVTSVLTAPFHIVRAATAVSGQGAVSVDRQTLLDFEPLASGSNNQLGANNPQYAGAIHVLRDGAAYNALFAQVDPTRRPPAVNFNREMVVAVLGSYIPRFGNTVQTLRLVHDAKTDTIRIIHRINPYRGGAAPPPATETPWQFLRVVPSTGTIRAERTTAVTQTPLANGLSQVHQGRAVQTLIRDDATYRAVWARHVGGTPPRVDFAVDQVIFAVEDVSNGKTVSVARSVLLEDDELSVTIHTSGFTRPAGTYYSAVTTPRTSGPVTFETIDVTPRP